MTDVINATIIKDDEFPTLTWVSSWNRTFINMHFDNNDPDTSIYLVLFNCDTGMNIMQ